MPTIAGVEVVECEPYAARLTLRSCIDRWQLAQTIGSDRKAGNVAIKRDRLKQILGKCASCHVGQVRTAESK